MPGWAVIPSIRTADLKRALAFYTDTLGFSVRRGTEEESNMSLVRGDANIMLEGPTAFYSEGYNSAIRERLGTPSASAMYIEATDLEELNAKLIEAGIAIIDPLADRPWGQSELTVADPDGNWLTFWKSPQATQDVT